MKPFGFCRNGRLVCAVVVEVGPIAKGGSTAEFDLDDYVAITRKQSAPATVAAVPGRESQEGRKRNERR